MTQYPGAPAPYPGQYQMPKKPASISVTAILAIVIGGLGTLCCGLVGLGSALISGGEARLPDGTVFRQDPSIVATQTGIATLDLITSVLLLAVGIGATTLKPWARTWGIGVSIAIILLTLAKFAIVVTWTGPEAEKMMAAMQKAAASKGGPEAQQMQSIVKITSAATLGVGVVVSLIQILVPALILIFWTKASAKAWFESGGMPPPSAQPYPMPPPGYPPQ